MRSLFIVTICLLLTAAAGTALADKVLDVQRLDDSNIQRLDLDMMSPTTCTVGNLNGNYYQIGDWIWGNEAYAYHLFEPVYGCCNVGFVLNSVTMIVYFAAADVPSTFQAYAGMAEAVFDQSTGCWVPGPQVCVTPVYTVNIPATSGAYAITLPLGGTCACADRDYHYFLTYDFVTTFPSTQRPGPVTDNSPIGCTSYNNYGAGWEDLFSYGFPGELRIYGDVSCCEGPVGADPQTWGRIKGMYK